MNLEKFRKRFLSEQSHKKKREKVSILELFRKRLFVGTIPPKNKKKREKVSILEKFSKRLFVGTVLPKNKKKENKCQILEL